MAKEQEVIAYKITDQQDGIIYEGDSRVLAVKNYAQPHSKNWFEKGAKDPDFILKFRRPESNLLRQKEERKWL